MDIGLVFPRVTGAPPGPDRPFAQWIGEVDRICHTLETAGFEHVGLTHGYHAASLGLQPFVLGACLAPRVGKMRIATQVLLLPLLNALDVAYNAASLDHITEGRFDLGIGIGYHPLELEAMGIARADRVPKLEESIEAMKLLWAGEPTHFHGKYIQTSGVKLEILPVQQPHPPIWGASQSHRASRRAGRMMDGIVIAPQVGFADVGPLLDTFRDEWAKHHAEPPTRVGAWRAVHIGTDPKDAYERLVASGKRSSPRYTLGGMKEKSMVDIYTEAREESVDEWAIRGGYRHILEGIQRCREEYALTQLTCNFYNVPADLSERLEWIEGFGEEVIAKL